MNAFPSGTQARISGVKSDPTLNGKTCVSLGAATGSVDRVQVRLADQGGRELALKPQNLSLAGSAGTLPVGSHVVLVGLAKAPSLNGSKGTIIGRGEEGSGRLLVDVGKGKSDAKALKVENLVLADLPEEESKTSADDEPEQGSAFATQKELLAKRAIAAAAKACPVGSKVRIEGIVEEKGRDNSGDPALNGEEGIVEKADPDEPGRLIVKLNVKTVPGSKLKEQRLKSLSYQNLVRLGAASDDASDAAKRPATTELSILGAGGKRCKTTEIAIASGDKTAAFASAARNREMHATGDAAQDEATRSNALIYARTDVTSADDEVAGAALGRLIQLCPNFVMKAVCVLADDVAKNGEGKLGSKTVASLDSLATWLSGGETDGILRRKIANESDPCGDEPKGLAACRKCTEKGLKGKRLLSLVRSNVAGFKDFIARGCKER